MLSEALSLFLDYQHFAYYTGHTFRGLTISERPSGYNVILRSYSKKGEPLYAMGTGNDASDVLARLLDALSSKGGESLWRLDKYAARGK